MTVKNAFRTYNVVDGSVVTRSSQLPHTDVFQSFYSSSAKEDPNWLGIQDTIFKNSDNSIMVHAASQLKGAVLQNLRTGCDAEFAADNLQRHLNDYAHFLPNEEPRRSRSCSNAVGFFSNVRAPVWLINVRAGDDGTAAIQVTNQGAPLVIVSPDSSDWVIRTRDSNRRLVPHPNIRRYSTIEQALEVEPRPPFIEYSCSGWGPPT